MYNRDIILTTAPSVDGYRIVRQLGVVYGETVFKHGILSTLGATIRNTIDAFKPWSTEISGTINLIERARKFAYDKMIEEAKGLGANAIISIQSDNTFGDTIMYLSMCGTAVQVVSEADYDKAIQEKLNEEKHQKEIMEQKLKERQMLMYELEARRMNGEITLAEQFLGEIENIESFMDIYKIWQNYEFDESYADVDKLIKEESDVERIYGKSASRVKEGKKKITDLLFNIQ